jgi:hypothetical protein
MNFVPRVEQAPEPVPPVDRRRLWLTSAIVTVFVSLSLVAVIWHVLEGSNPLSLFQTPEPAPRNGKIIEQYTRFRTEPVPGGEVVTGYRYASSTDAAPEAQYCYLMTGKEGSSVRYKLALANKNPGEAESYATINPEETAQLGIAADDALKLARERCRFDEWE